MSGRRGQGRAEAERRLTAEEESDLAAERDFAERHAPLPDHDFEGLTTEAARVGMKALRQVETSLPSMKHEHVIAAAKLGVGAITQREKVQGNRRRDDLRFKAIMLLAGGQFEALPEGEVIEGRAIEVIRKELLDEVASERKAAMLAAGYDDEGLEAAVRG